MLRERMGISRIRAIQRIQTLMQTPIAVIMAEITIGAQEEPLRIRELCNILCHKNIPKI